MKIEDLSLGEIVTAKPEAAAVFETFNLDFCCGGKQKLSEAIKDPEKLTSILNVLELIYTDPDRSQIDFDSMSLTKLVNYIQITHHNYVRDNIPLITQHLDKVVTKHGDKYPHIVKIRELFEIVGKELQNHMMKEELILFPRIIAKESSKNEGDAVLNISIEGPVKVMEEEHELAGNLLSEIRKLSNNYTPVEGACTTHRVCLEELKMFEADLHKHVHLENNILFPKAIKIEQLNIEK